MTRYGSLWLLSLLYKTCDSLLAMLALAASWLGSMDAESRLSMDTPASGNHKDFAVFDWVCLVLFMSDQIWSISWRIWAKSNLILGAVSLQEGHEPAKGLLGASRTVRREHLHELHFFACTRHMDSEYK